MYYTNGSTLTFNENGFTENDSRYLYEIFIKEPLQIDCVEFIFNRDVYYVNKLETVSNETFVSGNCLMCDFNNEPTVTYTGFQIKLNIDCIKDYYGNKLSKNVVLKVRV